uniref:Fatty acid desaturase domain-containing protein n=1 Tax=Homalodisca liturata TaxID=320908 RepID=A0A1B6ILB5_9HEMI
MPPNVTSAPNGIQYEDETMDPLIPSIEKYDGYPKQLPGNEYKRELVWRNIILFAYLHLAALYGAYLMLTAASWPTVIWAIVLYHWSGWGITAGAHRLWAHRSYKANLPLRMILVLFNTLAFEVTNATNWFIIFICCCIILFL